MRPKLSPAQQRVVDLMREGVDVQHHYEYGRWFIGRRSIEIGTAPQLESLKVIEREKKVGGIVFYRLAPEWQAE